MLTRQLIVQSAVLASLSDEQIAAIELLSKNDENTVIGQKIGELHGQYDSDILSVTGIKRNDGEKSYEYAKRVLNDFKNKLSSTDSLTAEIEKLKTEKTDLEAKLASGSQDAALKQQLTDANSRIEQMTTLLSSTKAEVDKTKKQYEQQINDIKVSHVFEQAVSGIKFKASIPESLHSILLDSAKSEILAKGKPDFVEENGKTKVVFRDANGVILSNPKNSLNPFTVSELLNESAALSSVIDFSNPKPGGGTQNPGGNGGNGGSSLVDISAAKTQVEADNMIRKHLMQNGITVDSPEYSDQSLKLRTENNVANLPIR